MDTISGVLAGAETSCGLLLAVAGVGKAYQATRRVESATAIRRALRVPRQRWRWVEFAVGTGECATAAAVPVWPAVAAAAMAVLGIVFCGLLAYVKVTGIPGGCGCLGGPRRYAADNISVRDVIRAAVLATVGVAGGVRVGGNHQTFGMGIWFLLGFLGLSAALAALSALPLRRPCNRPLLSPVRGTLRALASHQVYAAMAEAVGPFAAEVGHRRAGCDDEFWFVPESGGVPVVFSVGHTGGGHTGVGHIGTGRAGAGRAAARRGLTIRAARADSGSAMPTLRLPVR